MEEAATTTTVESCPQVVFNLQRFAKRHVPFDKTGRCKKRTTYMPHPLVQQYLEALCNWLYDGNFVYLFVGMSCNNLEEKTITGYLSAIKAYLCVLWQHANSPLGKEMCLCVCKLFCFVLFCFVL
jgi:hypothetical protein